MSAPPQPQLQAMLRKLGYWTALDAADKAALLALPHEVKSVDSQHYIVRERDRPTHSCVMLSGYSFRHKFVGTGGRQILAVHLKGDLVDVQNALLGVADHNVQMLTDGQIALIPRGAIKQIAFDRPNVGMALWYDSLVDGSIAREQTANVGRRDAYTRLAHLLCEFALRLKVAGLGKHNNYELPMTQEQLADALGLTPVHVNRTLQRLEKDGLIRRSNRSVSTDNWQKLAKAGDFDTTYLHLVDDMVV